MPFSTQCISCNQMSTVITPTSNNGQQIDIIIDFLRDHDFSEEADNLSQYLNDGNFHTMGWFLKFFIKGGFAPFPDSGNGATIYINPDLFPPPDILWDFNIADTRQLGFLMGLLLHEKYHAEEQDLVDRLWTIPLVFQMPLVWLGIIDRFNPLETAAFKYHISFLDKVIDKLLGEAFNLILNIAPINGDKINEIREVLNLAHIFLKIKISVTSKYNENYSPDFPIAIIEIAEEKILEILAQLEGWLAEGQGGNAMGEIATTLWILDKFEIALKKL